LRLAGEFQAYCRDLHDQSVDYFVSVVAAGNVPLESVLRVQLTANRHLDKGNPTPGNLGLDFSKIGLQLWPAIYVGFPKGLSWNKELDRIVYIRNAIAHVDEIKLAALKADGYSINLTQMNKSVKMIDALVAAMDDVVADYLNQLLGGGRPW
jgi:hypothetical protein